MISAGKQVDLRTIRLVGLDLDGTLTDGGFYYLGSGKWGQRFSVRDGVGIKLLQQLGVEVIFITHSQFESAHERAKMLGVEGYFGAADKLKIWKEVLTKHNLNNTECAYMGDERADLPILTAVGFSGTVKEAEECVRKCCHFVATKDAGAGAAREFMECIITARERENA